MLSDIILLSRLRNTGKKGCNLPVQLYNPNRLASVYRGRNGYGTAINQAQTSPSLTTWSTLETPSACHPDGDFCWIASSKRSVRSQCHSATPEYHPSPSPPTTRYLEIILFTDSLTLKLAAAQLCSAWHGLSPSAHLRSQLASTPGSTISPSDHLRITTNAMLAALCNATSQR